jgi:ABC-type lipoprotein release transport system permease subunit
MVLWQNARLALGGTLAGITVASAASSWLQSKLTTFQPPTLLPFLVVAGGVLALTQLASLLPARRAAYFEVKTLTNG